MDSFEVNKIVGAVLFTCLCLVALNITAGAIFSPKKPAKPGYEIAVQQAEQSATQTAGAGAAEEPIEQLLASADPKRGQASAKKCEACHTFEKGGANKIGPNLWGIAGRPRASEAGFNYSAAMKAKGDTWAIDELNKFLANPRGHIPGTTMSFAGLPRASERADVIAYLNTLSDNPKPLPTAAAAQGQGQAQQGQGQGQGQAQQPRENRPGGAQPVNPRPGNAGAQPNAQEGVAPKPK